MKHWEALGGVGSDAWVVIVSRALRAEVLRELHAGVTSDHLGEKKTLYRLPQRFYWVGMQNDACVRDECSVKKGPRSEEQSSLTVVQGGDDDGAAVDVAGPLPLMPRGNRYICVMMDYCTKWPEVYALPNHEAEIAAGVLINEFFTYFGVTTEPHLYQGHEFESRVFRDC